MGRRIAVLGTFDLENYGDLLFPLLARHELARRMPEVEVVPFSYHAKSGDEWPFAVETLTELPQRLAELDGLVVGGGHLVRFDGEVANGYGPPPGIHHPTGAWLMPAALAAAVGLPVVWNAVGASPHVDEWAVALFAATLASSALVAVRDRASQATLRAVSSETEVRVVPDTAFGVAALLATDAAGEDDFRAWLRGLGVESPYVVVQASPRLAAVEASLVPQLRALARRGVRVVEVPIGPVLDDRPASVAPDWEEVVRVAPWPHPLRLARLIAGAEAAVGDSLHLGITAVCHGVPLHRPRCWPGLKYEILGGFPGVFQFDDHGREPSPQLAQAVGRTEVSDEVRRCERQLATHWDAVAGVLQRERSAPPPPLGHAFLALPAALSEGGAAVALLRSAAAAGAGSGDPMALAAALAAAQGGVERLEQALADRQATVDELTAASHELRNAATAERERLERLLTAARDREHALEAAYREAADLLARIGGSRSWKLASRLSRVYARLARRRRGRPAALDGIGSKD